MAARSNLTKDECFTLIQFVCNTFMSKNTESAVSAIIEHLRVTFDVSCVSIREVISRPYSIRYTFESLYDDTKVKRINETVTFDEDIWNNAMERFAEGCYIYKSDEQQSMPHFMGSVPNKPVFMAQLPMYSGNDFLGVLDLVDFYEIKNWNTDEIDTLKICTNFICQYLYRINSSLIEVNNSNIEDSITLFMNYRSFIEELDKKISEIKIDSPIVVVYTDIHHFKYINETYGYKKGDELLKLASQAMSDGTPKDADVWRCRVYADNFITAAIVPEEIANTFESAIHELNTQICEILQNSCPNVRIHMNTGIFYIKDKNTTASTAIANANLARKIAKRENMNKPLIFSEEMMEEIKYQEYLNNELPKAIENHYLKVYYQPKINCADDSLYGAEALIRWQKPDGTFIYPDKFIPIFEKNGNITDVDFYVYREVFKFIRKRLDTGLPVFPVSMNVSRVHFRSNKIMAYIEELFDEYRLSPELVEFELTENIYMDNLSKADEFIKYCHDKGIQVSMDDFGSGYSSLNLISNIKINTLKIDRIFLKNGILSDNDKTVISTVIIMAKKLGMNVICEGVETESQAIFLKNAQCDQMQGYYYGKPMDEETFTSFVEKHLMK